MDLTFSKYDFQKGGEQITGYSISEMNKTINLLQIYRMGLSESALKPSSLFYHIVKYHVMHHVVLNYVEKITIAFLMSIHTKTLSAMMKNREKHNNNLLRNVPQQVIIIYVLFASVVQVVVQVVVLGGGSILSKCSISLGRYKVYRYSILSIPILYT